MIHMDLQRYFNADWTYDMILNSIRMSFVFLDYRILDVPDAEQARIIREQIDITIQGVLKNTLAGYGITTNADVERFLRESLPILVGKTFQEFRQQYQIASMSDVYDLLSKSDLMRAEVAMQLAETILNRITPTPQTPAQANVVHREAARFLADRIRDGNIPEAL